MVIGDYKNPILQPWAAAIVKQPGDLEIAGFAAPLNQTNLLARQCTQHAVDSVENRAAANPEAGDHLYSNDHQTRFIYLDQPHSAHVTPSWYGESVGHYEGDTLVVDTIGIAVKPMSLVGVFGTPHTAALHVVERFHVVDGGKTLRVDIDVEGPGTFTARWSENATFTKTKNSFDEYVCAEINPLIGIDAIAGEVPNSKYVAPF